VERLEGVRLVPVTDPSTVSNTSIRERVLGSSKGSLTKHFVVYDDGHEVAFLSVDLRTDINLLVIYEIFVPQELRGRGIGTSVLLAAEKLGRDHGFPMATLIPKALGYAPGDERDRETVRLVAWYERHGYRATEDSRFREWQKEL